MRGFTLIELLIAIGIIGILASVVISTMRHAREEAQVATAGSIQRQISRAAELYWGDIGFYPPDVNRGWDPGFAQMLPWNPDEAAGFPPPPPYDVAGTDCNHCPANWQNIVALRWAGPYINQWPQETPWFGKFDYNYWPTGASRPNGCMVDPGLYIGVQGDYVGNNTITSSAEQDMINEGFEAEACFNGESQLLLHSL